MDDGEKNLTPGAIAMLIVIPLALVLFAIDAIVLIRDDDAYRAARAKAPPPALTVDAASPAASAR